MTRAEVRIEHKQRIEGPEKPEVPRVRTPRSILVYLSYAWLFMMIAAAIFADLLPLASYSIPVGPPRQPPQLGSLDLLAGTDNLGRSMLSRCVYGAQVSLLIGTVATLIGSALGSSIGMLGGYFQKRTDAGIRLLSDTMLAFPPLILLMALTAVFAPGLGTLMAGLSLIIIPSFLRLARANTLTWTAREFVLAARNMGAGHGRILGREILPNVLPPLLAYLPIVMAALIVAEGSLSFLGLGIPPPTPSWGGMISDGKDSLATAPHLVFVPAAVIFCTVFALNQAGDHLRGRFDRTMRD
ncbi:ABC transporter permease [Nocardia flavorosea]|uniref:ABC transporter permease n=1 Tax=Nocardia flavorosea TaxID=53429 RepID=A0A846YNC5_9NOCA|nr:ABC transporter permease [Nocardia flavorosea]NKY59100.1 ABC transporter permease [Nocardia flavorosea]